MVNVRYVDVLATLIVAPQLTALYVARLVITVQITLHSCVRVNCGGSQNVSYRSYLAYKFVTVVAALRYKLGVALGEARKRAHRGNFSVSPYSNTIHRSLSFHFTQTVSPSLSFFPLYPNRLSIYNSTSSPYFSPSRLYRYLPLKSFSFLNPDPPISTNSSILASPRRTHRTKTR